MTTHPIFSGLPVVGAKSAAETRKAIIEGTPFVAASAAAVAALQANYGADGYIRAILIGTTLFAVDLADTTTAHDGVTCVVSSDGLRFKTISTINIEHALGFASSPPASPAIGNAWIVTAAPTGAFAAYANHVAGYTERGWVFAAPRIGQVVYSASPLGFFHFSTTGAWTAGLGATFADASISPAALLFAGGPIPVINATTTAPPGSPISGDAYVIASGASGAWSGKDNYVAIYFNAAWAYLAPRNGMEVYNLAIALKLTYKSGSWSSATASTLVAFAHIQDVGSFTSSGTITSPPTSANGVVAATIVHAAQKSGNLLIIEFHCEASAATQIAVYVDGEATPRWYAGQASGAIAFKCIVLSSDALSHTYYIRSTGSATLRGRLATLEELSL